MNPDPFVEFSRSVIRIPVAGPPPNNTLVFVRAALPKEGSTDFFVGQDDTRLVRRDFTFDTLYRIDGYLQSKAREYQDNTVVSVTGFLGTLAEEDDDSYVAAIDAVRGRIRPSDGGLEIVASIAEQDTEELTMAFTFSAWVLTYEPRAAEFPTRHERNWSLEDAVRIGERVTGQRPSVGKWRP